MKYTIQSNIPVPKASGRGAKPNPDSFQGKVRALKVGQSVFGKVAVNLAKFPKDRKFTTRTVDGGTRVWRIK